MSNELQKARAHPFLETASGLTAGVATTLTAHPLDLIKTRLQSKPPLPQRSPPSRLIPPDSVNRSAVSVSGSSIRIAQQIYHNEGGFLGFYRGISSNLIGNSVSWALYFVWYDRVKTALSTYHGVHGRLSFYDYFVASAIAGKFRQNASIKVK